MDKWTTGFMRSIYVTVIICLSISTSLAQTTTFTYQGKLSNNGTPATGNYDFEFRLFDALSGGAQQGATVTLTNVVVMTGIFTVQIDFGACPICFNGAARFLDISVRVTGGGAFTPLTPRQPVTATPYALKSANAATADGLSLACVSCVTSSQIQSVSGSVVSGPIPVESVPAGSASYIQITTTTQPNAFFDIDGSGHIGRGLRIEGNGFFLPDTPSLSLSSSGIFQIDAPFLPSGRFVVKENGNVGIGNGAPTEKLHVAGNGLFTGSVDAGTHYRIGGLRVFTVNGSFNDGTTNLTATNTFTGEGAGLNTTPNPDPTSHNGKFNSFFGAQAGQVNTTGRENAFVGSGAGNANTTGSNNAFFGSSAGFSNMSGSNNTFVGETVGFSNTTGNSNTFFGIAAGFNNTTGNSNTFIGSGTNFTAVNPTGDNNTLLGAGARVFTGVSNGTAIGALAYVLQSNSLVLGSINSFNGATVDTQVGIGTPSPSFRLHIIDSSNKGLRVETRTAGETVASFGGKGAFQIDSNGVAGGRFTVLENGNVGIGTTTPTDKLHINGTLRLDVLGSTGTLQLCRNVSTKQIADCSSSRRYKTNIATLHSGLQLINRLRPVTFDWKQSGEHDLGLVAEEVAKVEPLLVTHNDKGEIEGVKYDRVSVVLINAVKEQQQTIEALQNENHEIKARLAALERLLRQRHRRQSTEAVRHQ